VRASMPYLRRPGAVAERPTAHLEADEATSLLSIISRASVGAMRGDDMRSKPTVQTTLFALRPC
jgi:hypothetical protein